MPWLPGRSDEAERAGAGVLSAVRNPRLVRLAGVVFASTVATGVLITFLPLSAGFAGYPAAFLVTACLMLPALVPASRERRLDGPSAEQRTRCP